MIKEKSGWGASDSPSRSGLTNLKYSPPWRHVAVNSRELWLEPFISSIPYLYLLCDIYPLAKLFLQRWQVSNSSRKAQQLKLLVLIPDRHTFPPRNSQNRCLKPACILTDISNDISAQPVRMHYNPITNQLGAMGSLSWSYQGEWIPNPFCKVSVHLHLYISAGIQPDMNVMHIEQHFVS